jgi:flagellar protein FliO/FliZ
LTELVLRIGFSLFVVLGLMWALARAVRRPLGAGRVHGPLAVLNRQQLTRGAAVTVVRVAGRAMVLGVTDQHVSLLGEVDVAEFERQPAERRATVPLDAVPPEPAGLPGAHPAARTRTSPLDFLRDRTSRR